MGTTLTDREPLYTPLPRQDGLPRQVSQRLLDMIASGQLGRGDKLPPERELALQLGVSRNVLREAVRSLAALNIVDVRQGAGVFISTLDVESLMEPLEFAVSLEKATFRRLVEARLAFEPGIAALAARRATDDQLGELRELLRESVGATGDVQRFLEIDVELHGRIVRMADNPFLTRIMESVARLARSGRELTNADPKMRESSLRDHKRIVAAIVARDPDCAGRAMHAHLEHVLKVLTADGKRP